MTINGFQLQFAVDHRPGCGAFSYANGNKEEALVCSRRFSRRRGYRYFYRFPGGLRAAAYTVEETVRLNRFPCALSQPELLKDLPR